MSTPEQIAKLEETDRKLRAMAALFPTPGSGPTLGPSRRPYTAGLRVADAPQHPRTEPSDLGFGR